MRKILFLLIIVLGVASCNKEYDAAMKSADKNLILSTANKYYEKKKWKEALALYERLPNLVAGTDDAPEVLFRSAYANYYDKSYRLAGHQFKNFAVTYPADPRREEAAYMSAWCYYQDSRDYNLDQTSTVTAINELQDFLNNYPNSDRAKNIDELINELNDKLELKAFENARQYFKMTEYKAADVTFENMLDDYPATKYRPRIYDYMMQSKYQLAMNSVFDLKADRILSAIAFSRQVEKELPGSEQAKSAAKMRTELEAEKVKFAQLQKEAEAHEAEMKAKAERNAAKRQLDDERKGVQAMRDSAAIATPAPAATITLPTNKKNK